MARTLGGFHHQVVQRITGKLPKQQTDGGWEYPPIADVLREVRIKDLEVYIGQRQNMVVQFITTHTIMDLCLEVERHPGARIAK